MDILTWEANPFDSNIYAPDLSPGFSGSSQEVGLSGSSSNAGLSGSSASADLREAS